MLVNISNHSFSSWPETQKQAAIVEYHNVVDLVFPPVDPVKDIPEIVLMAREYLKKCTDIFKNEVSPGFDKAVHIMGEMTFCFALVTMLQKQGIRCVASTTKRIVQQNGNAKTAEFNFVRFRDYPQVTEL